MRDLILLRGLPGAGKSSFAEQLAHALDFSIFAADDWYARFLGKYEWSKAHAALAHAWCLNAVELAMAAEDNIAVHNTFTTEKELEPYLALAKRYEYRVISFIVENRHGGSSIHNVPDETMQRMKERFEIKL